MLTIKDFEEIVNGVQVPPYEFRICCMLCNRMGFNDVGDGTSRHPEHDHVLFLQAMLYRMDTDTGDWGWGYGGKQFLSPHMTEGEVVKRCLVAALSYAEHEVRESFLYKGKRIFGPHVSIAALGTIADSLEVRASRGR